MHGCFPVADHLNHKWLRGEQLVQLSFPRLQEAMQLSLTLLPSRCLMSAFKAYAEGISGKAHIVALHLG